MLDEFTFRRHADAALSGLKKALIQAESEADFEVEEQDGSLKIAFDDAATALTLTPNLSMRQIWISGLGNSVQLDWSDAMQGFILPRTGETLRPLVARLMTEHLGGEIALS